MSKCEDEKFAQELIDSKWWEHASNREIALFQLAFDRMCCPFGIFHKAVEAEIGRPIYTHELALFRNSFIKEILYNSIEVYL